MPDQDKELWVDLYRMAMMELENAKIAGRIGDARIEIAARLEKLREIPGLHTVEKQAIDDALGALRSLERTDLRISAKDPYLIQLHDDLNFGIGYRLREGVCKIIIRNDLYAGSEAGKATSALDTRLEAPFGVSNLLKVTNGQLHLT